MLTFNTSLFSWHCDIRTFLSEASDFNSLWLGDDFRLESEVTGKIVDLKLVTTDRDADGDIQAWRFVPVDTAFDFKVTVFND